MPGSASGGESQIAAPIPPAKTFLATAYCSKFGKGSINGTGVTAGGTDLRDGKQKYVVAAGPGSGLSMGDIVMISPNPFGGTVYFKVDDHGDPKVIIGRHIDIYIADCAAAKKWGRQSVKVTVMPPGYDQGKHTADWNPIKATVDTVNSVPGGLSAVANAITGAVTAFEHFISALFNSATWFRVGKVLVGVVIGIYGFMILTRPAVNALPPVVKDAAKVAAL